MTKPKILVQLDTDPQTSVFDSVVAVDAGVDQLFRHGGVDESQVQGLVHGAMFTRGPKDLHNTAVFIGGSNVEAGETLLKATTGSFFGPIRVSVMMDSNGSNTTAAAAVVAAGRHLDLANTKALVLAATGPVGQRAVRLLAGAGATVKAASRSLKRATETVQTIATSVQNDAIVPVEITTTDDLPAALEGVDLIIAAGAAGVELLPAEALANSAAKVAIDLNAVPPAGIGGIDVMDNAKESNDCILYGAIGVGGTKMKIHKAAIRRIFERNDVVMDVDAIYQLGLELE